LFIAEWMRDWVNVVTLKENGTVDSIEQFMPGTSFNHPIDLEIGPDGVLYTLEYGTYWFAKIKTPAYTASNTTGATGLR
jgi:cytochrome c